MTTPQQANLKQQKIFAGVQIVGGIAAATVAGYSFVSNVLAGAPVEGSLLALAGLTLGALGYAFYYTLKLGRIADAIRSAGQDKA